MCVVVCDVRIGCLGSFLQWVDISEFFFSRFSLSSIFLTEDIFESSTVGDEVLDLMKGSSISIRRRFVPFSRVSYFMRVFHLVRTPLQVQTNLYRGNRIVRQSPADAPLQEAAGRLLVRGTIPLTDLEPGAYTFEIHVKEPSSNSTSARQVHFWIQ